MHLGDAEPLADLRLRQLLDEAEVEQQPVALVEGHHERGEGVEVLEERARAGSSSPMKSARAASSSRRRR